LEKSISSFDTPHVFRFSWNWDLPIGKGKPVFGSARGMLNHIIGGWKVGGIVSLQSNLPLVAQLNADAGWPDDVGRIRPNWTGSSKAVNEDWKAHLNDPVLRYASYLNVAEAFSPTRRFTLGNAPRVIPYVRVAPLGSFDLSLIKEVRVNERVRVAIRAEMYNALNHPFVKYTQAAAAKIRVYSSLNYQFSDLPLVTASNISTNFADLSTNVSNRTMQVGLKVYF